MITKFKLFLEGVADKYAEKRFGIKPEFYEFDKKYNMMYNKPKEVYRDEKYNSGTLSIIKNPISLNNIGAWSRGIIDSKGYLYVEVEPITIHDRILKILTNLGVIHTYVVDVEKLDKKTKEIVSRYKEESAGWLIWMSKGSDEFITVQRESNTNTMRIGEHEKKSNNTDNLFKKAKLKNPEINFSTERIKNNPMLSNMGKGPNYTF